MRTEATFLFSYLIFFSYFFDVKVNFYAIQFQLIGIAVGFFYAFEHGALTSHLSLLFGVVAVAHNGNGSYGRFEFAPLFG